MRQVFSRYRCALIFKIGTQTICQRAIAIKPTWLIAMAAVVTVCSGNFNEVAGQVQERAKWLLPDVAKVTLDSSGQSQIDFNPAMCRRLGPDLCEYFRAHEYGHVNLRHLERGVPTRQAEREADIWAATNASASAVEAARQYFEKGRGGSRFHGSAQERAKRLKDVQTGKKSPVSVPKRVTIVVKPRNSGTADATSTKTRAPTQYSGGSRTMVVRKLVPHRTKKIVYVERSSPRSSSRSYYKQGYVPKGGFNNPGR